MNPSKLPSLLSEALLAEIRAAVEEAIQPLLSLNGDGAAELYDVDEIAKALKVEKSWIYARTRRRQNPIPHYKVGRYPRFDFDEVKAWLKKNKESP